jgi:hypothetical protein
MTRPQDLHLLGALEEQSRQLSAVIARLEIARRDLIPGPAGFWKGNARRMFDSGMDGIRTTADAGLAALRAAASFTNSAISQVISRV